MTICSENLSEHNTVRIENSVFPVLQQVVFVTVCKGLTETN
jgi:hypothetical protein